MNTGTTVRAAVGGVLMGLANLVPGISGGTMLLAVGIYPQFVSGVAELTTLRLRKPTVILIGTVVVAAAAAILTFAGVLAGLVEGHRWVMYSLFIGLTLGGVPVLWSMLGRFDTLSALGAIVGITAMGMLAFTDPGTAGAAEGRPYVLLLVAGILGASAMILPGISGAYLLIVIGQYLRILNAIEDLKAGLGGETARLIDALHVCIPVGIGVVIGVVGVSNLARWALDRHPRPTLGGLLGLLVGSVLGLWPFREVAAGEGPGAAEAMRVFSPTAFQVAASLALAACGFAISWGVSHLGRTRRPHGPWQVPPGRADQP